MSESRQARYARKERLRRKMAGLCGDFGCKENAAEDCGFCPHHREVRRQYAKRNYATNPKRREQMARTKRIRNRRRRAAGLCLSCNAPSRAQFCAKHVKRARLQERRFPGPATFCASCRKRGHYWEDCPEDALRADVEDFMSSGTTNLGEAAR